MLVIFQVGGITIGSQHDQTPTKLIRTHTVWWPSVSVARPGVIKRHFPAIAPILLTLPLAGPTITSALYSPPSLPRSEMPDLTNTATHRARATIAEYVAQG